MHSDKLEETVNRIIKAISNDNDLNPPRNLRWPCSLCNKNVTDNINGVQCDTCDKWCHLNCEDISLKEYEILKISVEP